jgi:hypothetical protein
MHEEEKMEEDHSLKEMVDIHFEKYLNKLRSEKELKDEKVEIIKTMYSLPSLVRPLFTVTFSFL